MPIDPQIPYNSTSLRITTYLYRLHIKRERLLQAILLEINLERLQIAVDQLFILLLQPLYQRNTNATSQIDIHLQALALAAIRPAPQQTPLALVSPRLPRNGRTVPAAHVGDCDDARGPVRHHLNTQVTRAGPQALTRHLYRGPIQGHTPSRPENDARHPPQIALDLQAHVEHTTAQEPIVLAIELPPLGIGK